MGIALQQRMEFGSLGPDWREFERPPKSQCCYWLVLLGGFAPAASAACCCTQLKQTNDFVVFPRDSSVLWYLATIQFSICRWQQLPPFKTRLLSGTCKSIVSTDLTQPSCCLILCEPASLSLSGSFPWGASGVLCLEGVLFCFPWQPTLCFL